MLSGINYAETLVRPAADESTLRRAVAAINALGLDVATTVATSTAISRASSTAR